jgi:hypothetical protein
VDAISEACGQTSSSPTCGEALLVDAGRKAGQGTQTAMASAASPSVCFLTADLCEACFYSLGEGVQAEGKRRVHPELAMIRRADYL